MLYLNISDTTLELISVKKNLFNSASIKGCAKQSLTESVFFEGTLKNRNTVTSAFMNLLNSAYPKPAGKDEKEIDLIIPDEHVKISRFRVNADPKTDPQGTVLEHVKDKLGINPAEYENFFRSVPKGENEQEILYTAILKKTVVDLFEFTQSLNLKMKSLTSRAFSEFELLINATPIAEWVICFDVDPDGIVQTVYDKLGPYETVKKRSGQYIKEIFHFLDRQSQEIKDASVLVMAGESLKEINISEISGKTGKQPVLMDSLVTQALNRHKLSFDTGGIPCSYFANPLGAYLQTKNRMSVNFALEKPEIIRNTSSQAVMDKVADPVQNTAIAQPAVEEPPPVSEQPVIPVENPSAVAEKTQIGVQTMQNPIIEYKKTNLSRFFSSKIFFVILPIIAGAIALILVFSVSGKSNFTIPFVSQPSPTPTVVPSPTITPTPTIDIKLKRSDLKLSIQNGTEKTGFAKDTADELVKKGYKNIAKSNADRQDYEKTVIKIRDDKKNYLPLLISDLSDKFDTSTIEDLDTESKFDVVVILGNK